MSEHLSAERVAPCVTPARIEVGQVWDRVDGRASVRVVRLQDGGGIIHRNIATGQSGRIHGANFRRVYRIRPVRDHRCEQADACRVEHDGDYGSAGHPGPCCDCDPRIRPGAQQ